ncbi:MAG: permease, partial [Syntrophobacterales bacterium]|nr:permease [Syntrophobacterales bacterium]
MESSTLVKETVPNEVKSEERIIEWRIIWKPLLVVIAMFLLCFYLPVESNRFQNAVYESLGLVKWYAREHVIFCLTIAFFIAGAIGCFISQASVMKYLGPLAPKPLAYGVASLSGSILAVCSCTVLPLFAGIWKRGAGLGPAIAFLYSGPAINILAIILTARILGLDIGIARAIGAIGFSIAIGAIMHIIFRHEEQKKAENIIYLPSEEGGRPLWQTVIYFAAMAGILIFANWSKSPQEVSIWNTVYNIKWWLTGISALTLGLALIMWYGVRPYKIFLSALAIILSIIFTPHEPLIPFSIGIIALTITITTSRKEMQEWFLKTWEFTYQMTPLLLFGVLIAGFLLGRPGYEGLIPSEWVKTLVGGNSLWTNLFSAVVGAFMYFATLTEVPIVQGLLGAGMGKGPALSLLLAGPALSLPNM